MSIVFLLVPATLLLVCIFVILFIFAVRRGQFDDLETPAYRVFFDDLDEESAKSERKHI